MKLKDQTQFSYKHTGVYLLLYFVVIGTVLPLLMLAVATAFGDFNIQTTDILDMPIQYELPVYVLGVLLFYWVSKTVLKTEWYSFSIDLKENLIRVAKILGIMLVGMMALNMLISFLVETETSVNQSEVEALAGVAPFYTIFLTLIFAPIVEELLFRGGFYLSFISNGIKPRTAIIISSLTFGLLHVLPSLFSEGKFQVGELLYLSVYTLMGYCFVEATRKTESIWGGILLHFLNNFIAVLVIYLV